MKQCSLFILEHFIPPLFLLSSLFIIECFTYKLKSSFNRVINKSFLEEMIFKMKSGKMRRQLSKEGAYP